jgi:hypothetical protein
VLYKLSQDFQVVVQGNASVKHVKDNIDSIITKPLSVSRSKFKNTSGKSDGVRSID